MTANNSAARPIPPFQRMYSGSLPVSHFVFLTLRNYSMIAMVNAVEALRMANVVTGQQYFEWSIATETEEPVAASNGLVLGPARKLDQIEKPDYVFVCGGTQVSSAVTPGVIGMLRRQAERGAVVGALCTGGYVLARAGLLNGYRASIHWENLSALREEFPRVLINDQLFTVDRNRITCSGGTAPLDLMLHLIEPAVGTRAVRQIAEQLILDHIRGEQEPQYVPLRARMGVMHKTLLHAARLMEDHIERPLPLETLAQRCGITRRQMERLFRRYVGCAPRQYYLQARLRRARELLRQTTMSITEIAVVCGFRTASHLCRKYREQFNQPPSTERRPRADSGHVAPSQANPRSRVIKSRLETAMQS